MTAAAHKDIQAMVAGIRCGNRRALAKAITLIENQRADKRPQANALVTALLPHTGQAMRIGISGVPGVGKSTFIEALGLYLIDQGKRVAVLAVDPSSSISGGSILGDKVRMEQLARRAEAFIRPSPSAGSLGGVTKRTRETMLACEAAGYDVILIETVGVGQSEITVGEMVDSFVVLLLPNAGDEIQGIKKGIVEMADILAVNKAEGEQRQAAERTVRQFENALHLLRPKTAGWQPPIRQISGLTGLGLAEFWQAIQSHRQFLNAADRLTRLRRHQAQQWFQATLRDTLLDRFHQDPRIAPQLVTMQQAIDRQTVSPHQAAEELVAQFLGDVD